MKVIGSKAEQRKERNTYKWKYKSQNSKTDLDIEPDWSSLLVWECACVFHVMQRGIQCMDNKFVEFTSPTATPAVLLWLCRGLCFPVCLPSWLYALLKLKGAIFYCSHILSLSPFSGYDFTLYSSLHSHSFALSFLMSVSSLYLWSIKLSFSSSPLLSLACCSFHL